jgi:hypothetical protein
MSRRKRKKDALHSGFFQYYSSFFLVETYFKRRIERTEREIYFEKTNKTKVKRSLYSEN